MMNTLTEVLQYLRNWFVLDVVYGEFTIKDGKLQEAYTDEEGKTTLNLAEGQYFRIVHSALNDGVWKHPAELRDEKFGGAVWTMGVPAAVEALTGEIEEWQNKYGAEAASPWISESYSRGSYSRSKGGSSPNGESQTWQSVFASRLAAWRKI